MANENADSVLARIERKLDEQAKRDERLIALLTAGIGKKTEQNEKKLAAWLL